MAGGSAQFLGVHHDAGELGHHRGAADERIRRLGHQHQVGQTDEQRRSADGRPVDDHHHGHDARTVGDCSGCQPPAMQRREAFQDVGAAAADDCDQRQPLVQRELRRRFDLRRRRGRQRPLSLAAVDIDPHHRSAVDLAHVGANGARDAGADGECRHRATVGRAPDGVRWRGRCRTGRRRGRRGRPVVCHPVHRRSCAALPAAPWWVRWAPVVCAAPIRPRDEAVRARQCV